MDMLSPMPMEVSDKERAGGSRLEEEDGGDPIAAEE